MAESEHSAPDGHAVDYSRSERLVSPGDEVLKLSLIRTVEAEEGDDAPVADIEYV
jgi:hypothetical protein